MTVLTYYAGIIHQCYRWPTMYYAQNNASIMCKSLSPSSQTSELCTIYEIQNKNWKWQFLHQIGINRRGRRGVWCWCPDTRWCATCCGM